MKVNFRKHIASLWWVFPLIIFDFLYYIFVQLLVERNSGNLELHGEALMFLFLISLTSIACVRLSDKLLTKISSLPFKYLINIFVSFFIFISLVIGTQYLIEQSSGPKSISYLLNQSMIFLFLHLIVGNAAIAVSYFSESKRLSEKLILLEKIRAEKDLKILQQQMDPHFLFNNLNTLTSLIPSDQEKAIQFTRKLSAIFRHSTDTADKELINLSEEVESLEDYMQLLSYRFGDSYKLVNSITVSLKEYLIVPMALQVVIENVLKHNVGNKKDPLIIEVFSESDFLIIRNKIRPKLGKDTSRDGIGLKNLNQQYQLISGRPIEISSVEEYFVVKIPLLKHLRDEDIDH